MQHFCLDSCFNSLLPTTKLWSKYYCSSVLQVRGHDPPQIPPSVTLLIQIQVEIQILQHTSFPTQIKEICFQGNISQVKFLNSHTQANSFTVNIDGHSSSFAKFKVKKLNMSYKSPTLPLKRLQNSPVVGFVLFLCLCLFLFGRFWEKSRVLTQCLLSKNFSVPNITQGLACQPGAWRHSLST